MPIREQGAFAKTWTIDDDEGCFTRGGRQVAAAVCVDESSEANADERGRCEVDSDVDIED